MRLVYFLIGKAVLEALFVAALVVGFYVTTFHTNLSGWSELNEGHIAGWVFDASAPSAALDVQLYVDDLFIADHLANVARLGSSIPQQASDASSDASHGFQFDIPTLGAGEHIAEVYVVRESGGGGRRVLQLIGKPLRFVTGASNGKSFAVR